MEKKKTRKKRCSMSPATTVCRVQKRQKKQLEKIGGGNHMKGLEQLFSMYDQVNRQPEQILMGDCEKLMCDLKLYYGDNHYNHFNNFPAFFKTFLKKGQASEEMYKKFMCKRLEKPIDDFQEGDD